MKKQMMFVSILFSLLIFAGCASTSTVKATAVTTKSAEKVIPTTIDFGKFWTGTVRIEEKSKSDLGNDAQVVFYSEWTLGEDAGNVYPKKFTLSNSGEEVKMNSLWDKGGNIHEGTYDVFVDIDGMPGTGTVKNLKLEKGKRYEVYITFNAARINVPLKTDGDVIFVYPAGTYDKYKNLGRLNNIPKEIAINIVSSYTENNGIYWLIPANIPLDIHRTFSNGEDKWFTNYKATPESFINEL